MIPVDGSAIVTRFAPSPSGRLHLGHAFSAIRALDFARANGGHFLLRIEDIDPGRTREEYVAGIEDDLRWLGLAWDGEVVRQSARLDRYQAALDRLRGEKLVYPCFCTRAEIAASAAAPHGTEGQTYPGTCRNLPPDERDKRTTGEPHCWRLDMMQAVTQAGSMQWRDKTAGIVQAASALQGDVVLARKDAPVSYHLAVTVDDAAQGVTDVVRGVDLFEATHVHRLLQTLLGLPTPRYHHHSLLTDTEGRRLAKRAGAPTLADLRTGGADPVALARDLRAGRMPVGFGIAGA